DSGKQTAAPQPAGGTRLGNLVAGRNLIVSMGTNEIAVYPQADGVLHELESEMKSAPRLPAEILEVAELELILGHSDRAAQGLEMLVKSPAKIPEADRAAELLRDLLVGKLSSGTPPGGPD